MPLLGCAFHDKTTGCDLWIRGRERSIGEVKVQLMGYEVGHLLHVSVDHVSDCDAVFDVVVRNREDRDDGHKYIV